MEKCAPELTIACRALYTWLSGNFTPVECRVHLMLSAVPWAHPQLLNMEKTATLMK